MEPDSSHYELKFGPHQYEIDGQKIECLTSSILEMLGLSQFLLSVDFISSEEMKRLNQEYRGKDSSTDVLSFPQSDFSSPVTIEHPISEKPNTGPPLLLGDIVISLSDAEANAVRIGQGLDREVCFLLVHGILHLCGHDHIKSDEEKLMLQQQQKIMSTLEESEPPPYIWDQCVRSKA